MQWTPDRNGGFSLAESAVLYRPANLDSQYGYTATNQPGEFYFSQSRMTFEHF